MSPVANCKMLKRKLKRIASTLLFGLACSIITALHISSQQLPDGEASHHQNHGERGRPSQGDLDKEMARDSGPAHDPGPNRQQLPQVHTHKPLGVRLQREMVWAVDDSSSDSVNSPQQQPPRKVDSNSPQTNPKHSAVLPAPLNVHNNDRTIRGKSDIIGQAGQVSPHNPPKVNNGTTFSKGQSLAPTELADIFIGVKTTGAYHKNRLQLILDTWLPLAQKQTYFFTDRDDPQYEQVLGDHLINTRCLPQHTRQDLCCKVAIIYDTFLKSEKRWFCHLDDDNYLNVLNLVQLLQDYDYHQDLYLGRASLAHPIQALDRDKGYQETTFWFATGGAGFCISRSLALKMAPLASGGQFTNLCSRVRLPDDVSMGFVIDGLLHVPLTKLDVFNSHLQGLNRFDEQKLRDQVTLSYFISAGRNNTISLEHAAFTREQDPTRMRSLHCMLYPETAKCS